MNLNKEDMFMIKTKDNQEKSFYKLITFKSNITNKDYIIYTDNGTNLFSSILLDGNPNNISLEEIKDDIDKEEVNKALLQVKKSLDNNTSL